MPKNEIAENDYDLSINRYKEVFYDEKIHAAPSELLRELNDLEIEIQTDLKALEILISQKS